MNEIQNFYIFIAAFSLSQILLSLAKILSKKSLASSEILFSLMLLCIGVYLTQTLVLNNQIQNPRIIDLIWQHLPTAIPGLFLFSCAAIFYDGFQFKSYHLVPFVLTLIPPLAFDLFSLNGSFLFALLISLPQALELVLVAGGLWIVATSWKNDLLENRRLFRFVVMAFAGAFIFAIIVAQQLTSISDQQIDLIHYPIVALFLMVLNLFLLNINHELQLFQLAAAVIEEQPGPTPAAIIHHPEFQKLKDLMEVHRIYQDESLTISKLATRLDLPEYKTRKLINETLGYRNFNEFLNHYRIQEASQRLLDSKQSITHIANDLGYNALSAFNRAFKEIHQQTPSEFRKNAKNN